MPPIKRSTRIAAAKEKLKLLLENESQKCGICTKEISETSYKEKSLECECCLNWFHASCQTLIEDKFNAIVDYDCHWFCLSCDGAASTLHMQISTLRADHVTLQKEVKKIKADIDTTIDAKINTKIEATITEQHNQALPKLIQDTEESIMRLVDAKIQSLKESLPQLPPTNPDGPVQVTSPNTSARLNTAVNEAISERDNIDRRKLNLMLNNVKELENKTDEDQVKELIANKLEITEAIRITDITRLGKITIDKTRLLRISVESLAMKRLILSKATKLRTLPEADAFHKVYIRPDLTPNQQKESKNLYEQLKARRLQDPTHQFKIQRGKIIQIPE